MLYHSIYQVDLLWGVGREGEFFYQQTHLHMFFQVFLKRIWQNSEKLLPRKINDTSPYGEARDPLKGI